MEADSAVAPTDVAHDEGHVFRLEIAAEPRFVSTARLFVAALARQYSCPEDRVQDLKVAISEACSNAIKAHRQAGVPDPIKLLVRSTPRSLTYEVMDTGEGFEFDGAVSGVTDDDPANLVNGGIGLTLIGALFPGFEVLSDPGKGTVLRFSVDLPTAS